MQCREVREFADSFLSGQLLVETNHEVVSHLETCPACRAEIAGRRMMREKLRNALFASEDLRPRPEFAAELAARLRPAAGMSRRSVLRSWWALAAGVVLTAGGGLAVRDARSRARLAALARDAAGDHQNCAVKFKLAEHPISLEEAGGRFGAPYAALASFDVTSADPSLQLIERHACVYAGRRFAHVVLRYHGALVSLLVTEGEPPATPRVDADAHGPAVASFPAGRFAAFIVGNVDRDDLLRLAQELAEPLARRLA
jgi:anti-sigma factor RsiW